MVNRELIRIKIVQLTYAYYQNGNRNIDAAEKELLFSLSKAYHLYLHLLLLIVAITKLAQKYYTVQLAKAEREGTPPPKDKFINNSISLQLECNEQLKEFASTQTNSWDEDLELIKKLYNLIVQSSTYNEYMLNEESSYEEDRELWRKLYKDFIMNNEDLDASLEEQSLYWNDDKAIVDTFVLKTIRHFEKNSDNHQELQPEYKDEEDRNFACKLFRTSILNADQYHHLMSDVSQNWDFTRLAFMDVVIMQIAIAEMLTFPNIPISVTINEYVNLAKTYSTPKSAGYINGMLDSIARHLIKNGSLKKPINSGKAGGEKKG